MRSIKIQEFLVFVSMILAYRDFDRDANGTIQSQTTRIDKVPSTISNSTTLFDNPYGQPINMESQVVPQQVSDAPSNSTQFPLGHTADPNTMNLQPNPTTNDASLDLAFEPASQPRRNKRKNISAAERKIKKPSNKLDFSIMQPSPLIDADIPTNIFGIDKMLMDIKREIAMRQGMVDASEPVIRHDEPIFNKFIEDLEKVKNEKEKLIESGTQYTLGPITQRTTEYEELIKEAVKLNRKVRESGPTKNLRMQLASSINNLEQIRLLKEKEAQVMKAKEEHIKQ
ncbi:hypothetical protein ENBRE01_1553 [Enteropsectra breve]|nr:hypothetical protein ENBRE01_1553 [Enteropsectra breve]